MNFPMSASELHPSYQAEIPVQRTTYRFPRPGQRPLVFEGTNLAVAVSFTPDFPFWYEINIFHTVEKKFALVVKMFFQSEDRKDHVRAWSFDSLHAVFNALEQFDAADDILVPFAKSDSLCPAELAGMAYELQSLAATYRSHWASLIGELFAEIDAMEKEFS